jgi:hypothetical protein
MLSTIMPDFMWRLRGQQFNRRSSGFDALYLGGSKVDELGRYEKIPTPQPPATPKRSAPSPTGHLFSIDRPYARRGDLGEVRAHSQPYRPSGTGLIGPNAFSWKDLVRRSGKGVRDLPGRL